MRFSGSAALGRIGALALLVLNMHCMSNEAGPAAETESNPPEEAEPGLWLSAARWSGSWDFHGIEYEIDGTWSTQNDLGYRVHLEQGLFVNYSAGFGQCDSVSGSAQALVMHAETDNPTLLETHFIEDLTHPMDIEFGELSFPAARYCWAHWLVARGEAGIAPKDGIDMAGSSIKLKGTSSRNEKTFSFSVDTFWPASKLDEIDLIVNQDDLMQLKENPSPAYMMIQIQRPLSRLFDGIDFETATPEQIQGMVLDHLSGLSVWNADVWVPGG